MKKIQARRLWTILGWGLIAFSVPRIARALGGELGNSRVYENGALGLRTLYPDSWVFMEGLAQVSFRPATPSANAGPLVSVAFVPEVDAANLPELKAKLILRSGDPNFLVTSTQIGSRPAFEVARADSIRELWLLPEAHRAFRVFVREGSSPAEIAAATLTLDSVQLFTPRLD